MAIADLLWACPVCHEVGSIQPRSRGERCTACRTEFRRGSGADIVARRVDGSRRVAAASVWFDELPPLEPASPHVATGPGRCFTARATARLAGSARPLRRRRRLIGWFEVFGRTVDGELRLDDSTVAFRPATGRSDPGRGPPADPSAAGWEWPLESLRVLQPSSSSIQLRHRDGTLVSLRFPGGSTLLWEVRFQAALRTCYRTRGLGEIHEFQPRICAW